MVRPLIVVEVAVSDAPVKTLVQLDLRLTNDARRSR